MEDTFLEAAPVVAVDAVDDIGLDDLRAALDELVALDLGRDELPTVEVEAGQRIIAPQPQLTVARAEPASDRLECSQVPPAESCESAQQAKEMCDEVRSSK